jgi:hypothetical protein
VASRQQHHEVPFFLVKRKPANHQVTDVYCDQRTYRHALDAQLFTQLLASGGRIAFPSSNPTLGRWGRRPSDFGWHVFAPTGADGCAAVADRQEEHDGKAGEPAGPPFASIAEVVPAVDRPPPSMSVRI